MVSERKSKRGNGEGSIYLRASDNRWVGSVTLADAKRKTIYGKTRREVADKINALLKQQHDGLPIQTEREPAISAVLTDWMSTTGKQRLKPSTYASYDQIIKNHIVPAIGKHKLRKLEPQHVASMMRKMADKGLSPRTCNYARDILRRILNASIRYGQLHRNVAALVDKMRQETTPPVVWTPEQAQAFLKSTQDAGDRLTALYTVALYCGLRQGELRALQWTDIDFDRRTLRVNATMPGVGAQVRTSPKTEKSRRTLPLPAAAITTLRQHRSRQNVERLRLGEAWADGGYVFTMEDGQAVHRSSLYRWFTSAVKTANVPKQRFHDMRHCCASFLLASGVSARSVMEILGHSSYQVTMNTYAHVLPTLLQDAADAMDRVLGGGISNVS